MLITLIACAALIAACTKKPAEVAAPAAEAAAPAAAVAAAAASVATGPEAPITLAQMPAPKAGLWQRVSTQDADAPQTSTKCLDGKPIDPMEGMSKCAKTDIRRTASGGFVYDGDCPANGVEAKIHMAGEGDWTTTFTTDSSMNMSGGGGPAMTMKNRSVWTYKGACPA